MARGLLLFFCLVLTPVGALAQTLKVGMSNDYPPLTDKQDGRLVGIEPDAALAVSKLLGRKLEIVELPFASLIPALQAGEVDVIMSGMSITEERAEQVTFTEPYLDIGQMAIILTEKAGRFGQRWAIFQQELNIGVEPDTTGAAFVATLENATAKAYADPEAAFAGLRAREIDMYVHDAPTSWQLATDGNNPDLISLYHPLTEEQLGWAVAKDNEALALDMVGALAELKRNGTLSYILNRWIPVRVEVK